MKNKNFEVRLIGKYKYHVLEVLGSIQKYGKVLNLAEQNKLSLSRGINIDGKCYIYEIDVVKDGNRIKLKVNNREEMPDGVIIDSQESTELTELFNELIKLGEIPVRLAHCNDQVDSDFMGILYVKES